MRQSAETIVTFAFCLATVFAIRTPCDAAVFTVDLNGGGDFTEIQPAIDAAADGDTVLVLAGEYGITEPIIFSGKAITVCGEGEAGSTIIRMSDAPADPERASVVVFENGETAFWHRRKSSQRQNCFNCRWNKTYC